MLNNEILEEKLREIPEKPGVYLMKNTNKIIYVGKAKNLKKRVLSYFNKEHESVKTRELVKNIQDIEYFICNSEVDALILENNLIKKHTPKYNVLLKDEKTYPYIKISREKFPSLKTIRTTRELDTKNGIYFGPYPMNVFNLKKTLVKIFKIRDCNRDMEKVYSTPCLKYYMHFCLGPCIKKDIETEYQELVDGVIKVLKGNGEEYIKILREKMEIAAREMKFEEAIVYKGQMNELANGVINQIIDYKRQIDEDYFVFKLIDEKIFIVVISCREGKIINKNAITMKLEGKIYNPEELEESIVINYYSKHHPPKNIIMTRELKSQEIILAWFEKIVGEKINFYFPKIKSRRQEILQMTQLNLDREVETYYRKRDVLETGLKKIYEKLSLKNFPRRIECFDISNIQGKDAVGSMSVAIEGATKPREYRKFKIQSKDTPDDFQMMREVITRRYSKLKKEEYPDAILIDGGLGQINAVGNILKELDLIKYIDLLSIAKREEEIYKYGVSKPYIFSRDDEALKIFQRVRDEAHRFGVTYHRKLRSKRVISSKLDEIKGIGEKRKQKLYEKFKTYQGIIDAEISELEKIIPKNIAMKIKASK